MAHLGANLPLVIFVNTIFLRHNAICKGLAEDSKLRERLEPEVLVVDVVIPCHIVQIRHFGQVKAVFFLLVEILVDGFPPLKNEVKGLLALRASRFIAMNRILQNTKYTLLLETPIDRQLEPCSSRHERHLHCHSLLSLEPC